MSRSQRTKGAAFERECVTALNEHGADAERNLSQSRDGGYDVDSRFGAFEYKKRHALPAYLLPRENVRGVIFAHDRGERLILLRFKDAARLMAQELEHLRQGATMSVEFDSVTAQEIATALLKEPDDRRARILEALKKHIEKTA